MSGGERVKKGSEKKKLSFVLGILVFLIVALVVGNIAIFIQANNAGQQFASGDMDDSPTAYVLNEDGTKTPLDETLFVGLGRNWSVEVDGKSFDEVVAEYQALIDAASNGAEKVKLYNERIEYILDEDEWQKYSDLILSDAIAVDDIEQSADSATQVINIAFSLNDDALAKEYIILFEARTGKTDGPGSSSNTINYLGEVVNG